MLEREREKKRKYRELAADLAGQWRGFKVDVIAVVVGTLGLVCGLDGSWESSVGRRGRQWPPTCKGRQYVVVYRDI